MQLGSQYAPAAAIAEDNGASTIAKEDAGASVTRIDELTSPVDADDQRISELATLQVSSGCIESKDKSGTGVYDIKSQGMVGTNRPCTRQAVEGIVKSGVLVATMITSMSCAASCDCFKAACAAPTAKSVDDSFTAQWRDRMPIRLSIHSGVVSIPSSALK